MHSKEKFTAEQDGYLVTVETPYWQIVKDGVLVDSIFYHTPPPTMDELNAKVQAERCLNKILQPKNQQV